MTAVEQNPDLSAATAAAGPPSGGHLPPAEARRRVA
jgi:hypothetical protein